MAVALVFLLLATGFGTDIYEAVTHLRRGDTTIVIIDETTLTSTPSETTQTTEDGAQRGYWEQLSLPGNGGEITALVMDPVDPSVLYAGMSGGRLFKSSDGAESWAQLSVGDEYDDSYVIAFDPASPSTVYVLAWMGSSLDFFVSLFRSDDGGTTWTNDLAAAGDGPPGTLMLRCWPGPDTMWLDPASSPSAVYISAFPDPTDDTVEKTTHVWRSTDRGVTWTELGPQEAAQAVAQQQAVVRQQAGEQGTGVPTTLIDADTGAVLSVSLVRIDPGDPSLRYAATDHGVYKSTDSGTTWRRASLGVVPSPVLEVVPDPGSPSILYAATPDGIMKSGDAGATWSLVLGGQGSLALAPSAPSTLYAWTSAGLFRTDDGGVTWTRLAGEGLVTPSAPSRPEGELVLVAADSPDTVFARFGDPFAEPSSQLLFRSTDGGTTWSQVLEGVAAFATDPQDPSTLYAATATGQVPKEVYQVLKSMDAGDTWTVLSLGESVNGVGQIALDAHTPSNVYVVESRGGGVWPKSVFRSPDGGATWEKVDLIDAEDLEFGEAGPTSWTPMRLLFDPRSPDTLYVDVWGSSGANGGYASGTAGFYRSTDGGATWQNIATERPYAWEEGRQWWANTLGAAGVGTSTIVIDPAPGGGLYAPGEAGLLKWVPGSN